MQTGSGSQTQDPQCLYSFIQTISIAPLQVLYYLEVLSTQHGYCAKISHQSATGKCMQTGSGSQTQDPQCLYSFIQTISIAPLQVLYYSEVLPTQHGYCAKISHQSATGKSMQTGSGSQTQDPQCLYSFIQTISIAPLQVLYYSEVLPTQHGYCAKISHQ